jgi:hypothetical protein
MEQTLHTPAYSYTLRDSKPQAFSFQLPNVWYTGNEIKHMRFY